MLKWYMVSAASQAAPRQEGPSGILSPRPSWRLSSARGRLSHLCPASHGWTESGDGLEGVFPEAWSSSFSTQSITLWGVSPHVSKGARLLPWTELGPGRLRGGLDTDGLLCTEWLPSVLHGRLRLNRIRHSLLLKTVPMATHMGRWMQLSTCPLSARPEAPGGGEAGMRLGSAVT